MSIIESRQIQSILEHHAPIIFFHSNEEYFPSTIEYFLANCEETDAFYDICNPSSQSFNVHNSDCKFGFRHQSELSQAPYYVTYTTDVTKSSSVTILYYLFFPHTESRYFCNFGNTNELYPTTESIKITIVGDKVTHVEVQSQHIPLQEIEWFQGKIVLYCTKSSHKLCTKAPNSICNDNYAIPFIAKTIEIIN